MRTKPNRFESSIELLEARIAPASIVRLGADLAISHPEGNLLVETTATPGELKITDNSGTVTFGGIIGKLAIAGRSSGAIAPDQISIVANVSPFQGSLFINAGNGDDTVNLSGKFNQGVNINTGLGTDKVVLNDQAVTVGKSLKMSDSAGTTTTFDMNDRNLTVGGSMSLLGISLFDMGTGNTLKVATAMKITANPSGLSPLTVLFSGTEAAVGGSLAMASGFTNDTVSITSKFSVGGSLNSKLGFGDNTIVLTPTAGSTGIAGAFNDSGRDGNDIIVFGANSVVSGPMNLLLGNGLNTFVDTATSVYKKNLTVNGGFNTNTCVILGKISGNLSIAMAAGGASNTTVFTGSVGAGKEINYHSGNSGTLEVVTLAPTVATVLDVNVKFGNGSSTFNLGPNVSLTGKVIGTGGTYTFNQGTAILLPTVKLINYPT